ncbi:ATP-binding cassette domain-containing protein [Corynebacterium urealyticum]|uniref:ABC transporter transmembrane domain-containing protein n=1 Tax=Corynebacterium urealyticum TaxID=43771 RepID=UPI0011E6BE1F|nr:ABC transporter transmembrane domain-containing protein [Corynebacterium urealyticum]TYR18930.1 ATP-binding cassette domain-containing protein [Corynebacterium urealyticum]
MQLLRVSTPARRWVLLSAALSVAGVSLSIAAGLLLGHLVAGVLGGEAPLGQLAPAAGEAQPGGIGQYAQRLDLALSAWLVAVAVLRALVAWAQSRLGDSAADTVVAELRRRGLAALTQRDPRTVDVAQFRSLLTSGLDAFRPYLTGFLPAAVATFLSTPIALAAIWFQDRSSALIAAVTIPLIPFFMWLVGLLTAGRTERKLADMALLSDQLLDLSAGLPTLTAHGQQLAPTSEVERLARSHQRSTMGVLRIAFLSGMVLEFLATLSVALVSVNIGFRLLGGDMSLAAGLAVLIIVPEVYAPIREVGSRFHDAQDGAAAANAVLGVLDGPGAPADTDTPPAAEDVSATQTLPDTASLGLRVVFEDYSAPGRDGARPAGLSGQAEPGKITVLRGDNGAGKSTALLAALGLTAGTGSARVEEVAATPAATGAPQDAHESSSSGKDRSDGRNVEPAVWAGHTLWQRTAYLPQRPVLDEAAIGDTSQLSLGQRQRRAFAEQVPGKDLLILDEPTAHLDSANAGLMIGKLRAAAEGGATVLAASHDPLLIAAADRVIEVRGTSAASAPSTEVNEGGNGR